MMTINDIATAIKANQENLTDDCLYVEVEGKDLELCRITIKNGKLVLRPETLL